LIANPSDDVMGKVEFYDEMPLDRRNGFLKVPDYLQIELTDICNLKCSGCPRSYVKSSNKVISLDSFERIINKIPGVNKISFTGSGEVLTVNNFSDYIGICASKNIYSSFNTNGILMGRAETAAQAGINKISVSVDTSNPSLLAKMRGGIDVETINSALGKLVSLRDKTNIIASVAVTLGNSNIYQFHDLIKYLSRYNLDEITVESFHHWGNDLSDNHGSLFSMDPRIVIDYIEYGLETAISHDVNIKIFDYNRLRQRNFKNNICPWIYDGMYVTHKGDVTPCCINIIKNDANFMGNILDSDIDSIWQGEKYNGLRNSFFTRQYWDMCSDCSYRYQFGDTI
jgi:radical SAM protein with 4Fe4S-binding SPASM domain